MASDRTNLSSLAFGSSSTLVLKIGAECSNPARSDLCGGPGGNLGPYRDCRRCENQKGQRTDKLKKDGGNKSCRRLRF